jgi:hypothetical protein
MKFQPGQNRIQRGGTTYIKDVVQTQVDPPKKEIIQPKEEIKKPKKEKDESIQHGQVVQKPVSKRGRPKRK